ncbi:MAG: right-handed parallel beta-helix repeat-containing protein [Coprothermobacterota bacterium]|nr:right-handed parallel beta-helix repeat-containing protein [Coprothermobacterota bacterium]
MEWTIEDLLKDKGATLEAKESAEKKPVKKKVLTAPVKKPTKKVEHRVGMVIVSAEGTGDFLTLAEAVEKAPPGDVIRVLPGIYREHLIVERAVQIVGDDKMEVIVETEGNPGILIRHSAVLLKNLTIVALENPGFAIEIVQGEARLEACEITSGLGGGVWIRGEQANPIILDCRLQECFSEGILVSEDAQGAIESCEIAACAIGLAVRDGGDPLVQRCRIQDSRVGVSCQAGMGSFEECRVKKNETGFHLQGVTHSVVSDCKVYGNRDGFRIEGNWQGEIEDCQIEQNKRFGIWIDQSEPNLHRNRIRANMTGILLHQCGGSVQEGCVIDQRAHGIVVTGKGRPQIAAVEIGDNGLAGIVTSQGANPRVGGGTKIRNNDSGILSLRLGSGQFEDCEIYENKGPGVWVLAGGRPSISERTLIRDNAAQGVLVEKGGGGHFSGPVTGNGTYGFEIEPGANPTLFYDFLPKHVRDNGLGNRYDRLQVSHPRVTSPRPAPAGQELVLEAEETATEEETRSPRHYAAWVWTFPISFRESQAGALQALGFFLQKVLEPFVTGALHVLPGSMKTELRLGLVEGTLQVSDLELEGVAQRLLEENAIPRVFQDCLDAMQPYLEEGTERPYAEFIRQLGDEEARFKATVVNRILHHLQRQWQHHPPDPSVVSLQEAPVMEELAEPKKIPEASTRPAIVPAIESPKSVEPSTIPVHLLGGEGEDLAERRKRAEKFGKKEKEKDKGKTREE